MAEQDPGNGALHSKAGGKYLLKLKEMKIKREQYGAELERLNSMTDEHTINLGLMRDSIKDLQREKAEMAAEYMAHRNTLRLEEKLSGVATSGVDQAIVAVREKVENMRAQVQIAHEMRGVTSQGDVYAEIGAETNAVSEFERLLQAREAAQSTPTLVENKVRDLG